MARRRVNTKFVIVLGASLVAVGGAVGGVMGYRYLKKSDPVALKAKAQEQEKAGNLKEALDSYVQSANASSTKHLPGTDETYAYAAKLALQLSKDANNQGDALRYYDLAYALYWRAWGENPRNKVAAEFLMEVEYQKAQQGVSEPRAAWTNVEQIASRRMDSEAELKARLYRAEARFKLIELSREPQMEAYDAVEEDLNQALQMDPKSGPATALYAQMRYHKANVAAERAGAKTFADLDNNASFVKETAEVLKSLTEYIQTHGTQPDVALNLAQILFHQHRIQRDPEGLKRAIIYLEDAYKADNTRENVAGTLGLFYEWDNTWRKAETLNLDMIKLKSGEPRPYFRAADLYREYGDAENAIKYYKEALAHPQIGNGIEMWVNEHLQRLALEQVAWQNLDLAEKKGVSTPEGQQCMKEAVEYTDKLRARAASVKGAVGLLDGRVQLINRNVGQAMQTLRDAESSLSGSESDLDRVRYAKQLLATANEQQSQLGVAKQLVNDAVKTFPRELPRPSPRLQSLRLRLSIMRGRLLLKTAEPNEAMVEAQQWLGNLVKKDNQFTGEFDQESRWPASYRDQFKRIYAEGAGQTGMPELQKLIVAKIQENRPDDLAVTLQLALSQLYAQNFSGAVETARQVLATKATNDQQVNEGAYNIAVAALAQLKKMEEARQLADEAVQMYPNSSALKILRVQAQTPDGGVSPESRKLVIEALTDPFMRQSELASFYRSQGQMDKELESLRAAEALVAASNTPEERDRLGNIVERAFNSARGSGIRALQQSKRVTGPEADKARAEAEVHFKVAQEYVAKAEKLNLDMVDGKVFRGRLELARSGGTGGIQLLETAVQQNPDGAMGHLFLAEAYFQQESYVQALSSFRKVLEISPNNVTALHYTIALLMQKGDTRSIQEAEDFVRHGLRIAPRDPELTNFSDILFSNTDDAIKNRVRLLEQQPDNASNILGLANLYVRKYRKDLDDPKEEVRSSAPTYIAKAISLIEPLQRDNPTKLEYADQLAKLNLEAKRIPEGLRYYDVFLKDPKPENRYRALLFVQEFHKRAGQLEQAKAALEEALKLQPPGSDVVQRVQGDLFYDMGDFAGAETVYAEVLAKSKDAETKDVVERRLAESRIRQNDPAKYQTAEKQLAELLSRKPGDKQSLILRVFLRIKQGQAALLKGDATGAQQSFAQIQEDVNKVLAVEDGNPEALYYRGMANVMLIGALPPQRQKDMLDDAVRDLVAAGKSERQRLNSRQLLAQVYEKQKKYDQQAVVYSEVLRDQPKNYPIRVEYAEFLLRAAARQMELPADSRDFESTTLRALGPVDKLVELLIQSQAMYRADPRWPMMYADLLTLRGNYNDAKLWYAGVWAEHASEAQVIDGYVQSLLKVKEYTTAIDLSSQIISGNLEFLQRNPKYVVFFLHRATAYQAQDKKTEALKDIDGAFTLAITAARERRDFTPFVTTLNQSVKIVGHEAVVQRLKARVDADANDVVSRVGLVQVLLLQGKGNEAALLAEALPVSSSNPAEKLLSLRMRAMARYQGKNYRGAREDYLALLNLAAGDVESLNNLAFMLAEDMKVPEEAIPYAERAFSVVSVSSSLRLSNATRANVLDTLGWAKFLINQNQVEEAIVYLRMAVTEQSQLAAFVHLAKVYMKADRNPEARLVVEDGIKLSAKLEDAENTAELKRLQDQLK